MVAKKGFIEVGSKLVGREESIFIDSKKDKTIRQNHKAQRIVPIKTKNKFGKIILTAKDVKDNGDTSLIVLLISYLSALMVQTVLDNLHR